MQFPKNLSPIHSVKIMNCVSTTNPIARRAQILVHQKLLGPWTQKIELRFVQTLIIHTLETEFLEVPQVISV